MVVVGKHHSSACWLGHGWPPCVVMMAKQQRDYDYNEKKPLLLTTTTTMK